MVKMSKQEEAAFQAGLKLLIQPSQAIMESYAKITAPKEALKQKYKWNKKEDKALKDEITSKGFSMLDRLVDIHIDKNKTFGEYVTIITNTAVRTQRKHLNPLRTLLYNGREVPHGKNPAEHYTEILKEYLVNEYKKRLPTYSELIRRNKIKESLAYVYYRFVGPPSNEQAIVRDLEAVAKEIGQNLQETIDKVTDKEWLNGYIKSLKKNKVDKELINRFVRACFQSRNVLHGYQTIGQNLANLANDARAFYQWYINENDQIRANKVIPEFEDLIKRIDAETSSPFVLGYRWQLVKKANQLINKNKELISYFSGINDYLGVVMTSIEKGNVQDVNVRNLIIEIFGFFSRDTKAVLEMANETIKRRYTSPSLLPEAYTNFYDIYSKEMTNVLNYLDGLRKRIQMVNGISNQGVDGLWQVENSILQNEIADESNFKSVKSKTGDWLHHRIGFINNYKQMINGEPDKGIKGEDQFLWLGYQEGNNKFPGLNSSPALRGIIAYLLATKPKS